MPGRPKSSVPSDARSSTWAPRVPLSGAAPRRSVGSAGGRRRRRAAGSSRGDRGRPRAARVAPAAA
eukprot:7246466-Lingulodinium_polyedra.AAC.1